MTAAGSNGRNRRPLSNCVGGVLGCVRGRSPAFMGAWSVHSGGLVVSPQRTRTVVNETETETAASGRSSWMFRITPTNMCSGSH
jgi:hypothetical protein